MVDLVVAVDQEGGLGLAGELPWRLQAEWQHFLSLVTRCGTGGGAVCWVLGRRSWQQHSQSGGLLDKVAAAGCKVLLVVVTRNARPDTSSPCTKFASSWPEVSWHCQHCNSASLCRSSEPSVSLQASSAWRRAGTWAGRAFTACSWRAVPGWPAPGGPTFCCNPAHQ